MAKSTQLKIKNTAARGSSAQLKNTPLRDRAGETLIEAVIAISMFLFILAPASAMYVSSIRTVAQNRNDLIGAVLAEEGVEMLRNMRDTNALKFSPKADVCWNTVPEHANLDDCETKKIGGDDTVTTPRRLRLALNADTLLWTLEAPADPTSQLAEDDLGIPADGDIEEFRLRHDALATALYFLAPAGSGFESRGVLSPFYRQVTIEYLNLDASPALAGAMKVTSLVQYSNGGELRNIRRVLIMTNAPLL